MDVMLARRRMLAALIQLEENARMFFDNGSTGNRSRLRKSLVHARTIINEGMEQGRAEDAVAKLLNGEQL